jgi:nicotinate-nucleotide pyrophosphorylase (carboxylating)
VLHPIQYRALVQAALLEDLGRAGDLTSDAIVAPGANATADLVARKPGVLAGRDVALEAFRLMDPGVAIETFARDGDRLEAGTTIARIAGNARAILAAERTALNFATHLCGVATATRRLVDLAAPHGARIVCTRKTLPGLRALEKDAVRAGGGANHRFGLDDAILIKDNHVALAGGVGPAVEAARRSAGHLVTIEVEVDTLAQLDEALAAGAQVIMLDNMPLDTMREAVRRTAGRAVLEASGSIDATTVAGVAATGVDVISSGAITHSAIALDLALDVVVLPVPALGAPR